MGVRKVLTIILCAAILCIPLRAGRTTNGSSDFLQGIMTASAGIFPLTLNTQAQGTVSFVLNLIAFPTSGGSAGPGCGVHCGEIINIVASHITGTNGCQTTDGACLDIYVCPNGTTFCTGGKINVDITTPNVGEASAGWPVSTGLHQYTFLLNRTAANNQMYQDGVLVTLSGSSNSGDPGPINYIAGGAGCGSGCPITLMAGNAGAAPNPDSFANGTISDVGIWNVTLSTGEITSLANCVPPNRIQPEHVVYWPIYGVDSPEPGYTNQLTGSTPALHVIPLTLTGTTKTIQQSGCQPGGAYR